MIPELSSSADDDETDPERTNRCFSPKSRNHGKIPKKIQKSEREKKKRDHLNDLFYELGSALEPARENNNKAAILSDAARILQDLNSRIDSLRRENAALTAESRHKSTENDELREEKLTMEAEIESLQEEVRERMESSSAPALTFEGSVYVIPVDLSSRDPPADVSRPQARYPTGVDSWSAQILCPRQQQQQQPPRDRKEKSTINFF